MIKITLILTLLLSTLFGATFNVSTTAEFRQVLLDVAHNGQDDIIILADGVYKTTDDANGTFLYTDNEIKNLTIEGSSPDTVIISGDNRGRVMDFNNNSYEGRLTLKNITIRDGNITDSGAGFLTNMAFLDINNTKIIFNKSVNLVDGNFIDSIWGGGFFTKKSFVNISDSNISYNEGATAAFSAWNRTTIKNSIISNNIGKDIDYSIHFGLREIIYTLGLTINDTVVSNNIGSVESSKGISFNNISFSHNLGEIRGYGGNILIDHSDISNNTTYAREAGLLWFDYNVGTIEIKNTIIKENNITCLYEGIQARGTSLLLENAIISHNTTPSGYPILRIDFNQESKLINSLIVDNTSGVFLYQNHTLAINSIFINNGLLDIDGLDHSTITLDHSFVDLSHVNIPAEANNLIYTNDPGFVDRDNNDFHLISSSSMIDSGNDDHPDITIPTTDLDGNARVVGADIDVGPYEFSTTKPTITSFAFTGEAKAGHELSFSATYAPSSGRTIVSVEYDFLDDGNWQTTNTFVYSQYGTYQVKIKITDSVGEFSVRTLDLSIADIPFNEKPLNSQLEIYITDTNDLASVKQNIQKEVDKAVDACKANPKSCGIKSGVVVIPL